MTSSNDNARNDRGVAMMYVAVFLMSSLWLISLAVDMGKLMTTKTELQRAADAAALAGASAINPATGVITQATARLRAATAASSNTALQERSEAVDIDPDNDVEFLGPRQVRVTVRRAAASGNPMTTIFAQTLGIASLNITANATAEAAPLTGVCKNLLPFAPVQASAAGFSKTCGSADTLKTSSGSNGNFHLLSFPPCDSGPCAGVGGNGGAAIRCFLDNGYGCCVVLGEEWDQTVTKPGNNVGPVRQGLQARWDSDTDRSSNICYQQYAGNGRRVLPVPIVQTFTGLNGRKGVRITGFAGFFMLKRPSGGGQNMAVIGQFIDYVEPGIVGGGNPPPNALYTLRLVE